MASAKVAISLDPDVLERLDHLVERGVFPNRSKAIQEAIRSTLAEWTRHYGGDSFAEMRRNFDGYLDQIATLR